MAAAASCLALRTGELMWKLAVPAGCALALVAHRTDDRQRWREIAPVLVAFGFALVGDAFLSLRAGRVSWFLAGIAAYFCAHLGYLTYSLRRGRLHGPTLAVALTAFLAYAVWRLAGAVPEPALRAAVIAYGLVSCASLAAAAGLRQGRLAWGLFVGGIALLVFSDTLISFNEFLGYRAWNGWILPTYYLALLAIAGAVRARGPALPAADGPKVARPPRAC
jgi:hypothetical protein